MEDVGDERFALEQAERNRLRLGVEQADNEAPNLRLRLRATDAVQAIEVEAVEQRAVNPFLQLLIVASGERPLRPCVGR